MKDKKVLKINKLNKTYAKNGLDKVLLTDKLIQKGIEWESFFSIIVSNVAIIHAMCGNFMPLFIVIIMTRFFGKNKYWLEGISIFLLQFFQHLVLQYLM